MHGAPQARPACAPAAPAALRWRAEDTDATTALFEDPVAAEEWDAKKQAILNRFAVQGNITVNAHSFDVVGRAKRGCVV